VRVSAAWWKGGTGAEPGAMTAEQQECSVFLARPDGREPALSLSKGRPSQTLVAKASLSRALRGVENGFQIP
jgi:hypothetical protein